MYENMINNTELNTEKKTSGKINKTWHYAEKMNKHVVEHTISVNGNRLTHVSEVNELSQAMKQRSDISLKNLRAVSSYYGFSRNLVAVIILALLAAAFLIIGFALMDSAGFGIFLVMFVFAAIFGVIAYILYTIKKPSFVLQIETYDNAKYVVDERLAYGNTSISFGKKKLSYKQILIMVIIPIIGICYLLFRSKKKGNKYKFMMDPETGHDIINTLGELI